MHVPSPPAADSSQAPARWTLACTVALAATSAAAAGFVTRAGFAPDPSAAAWTSFPIDDAWIHQVYARGIAAGDWFQYNPGEPETGATSPLWAVVLAGVHGLGWPVVPATKGLGVVLTAAAAVIGFGLARRLAGPLSAWLYLLALPALPYVGFASVSGTEVPLFVMLQLAVAQRALAGRWRDAGLVAGLAVLARPEGLVLLPALAVAAVLAQPPAAVTPGDVTTRPPAPTQRWAALATVAMRPVLPALAVQLPWVAYCVRATGQPLAATFYAKTEALGLVPFGQWFKVAAFLSWQPFLGAQLDSAAAAVVGGALGLLCIGFGIAHLYRSARAGLVLLAAPALLFLLGLAARLPLGRLAGADEPGSLANFYFARYLLPAVPLLLLVWAIGVGVLVGHATRLWTARRSRPAPSVIRMGLVAALIALPVASSAVHARHLHRVFARDCWEIDRLDGDAGRWIAAHLPADAVLGVNDAGALRYFGGRRTVDLLGLNSHRILAVRAALREVPPKSPQATALLQWFWKKEGIDHVAIFPRWNLELLAGQHFERMKSFDVQHNTIAGDRTVVVARVVPRPQ
ncbi:MAG: hypothetical protein EXR79_15095 [Myxococcales bacterium]|nr:hypothetical protein [Myxococcales bacterium]